MRAAVALAGAFLLFLAPARAEGQDEVAPDPIEHAGVDGEVDGHGEGGGHGEHEGHAAGGHHGATPPLPTNWYEWHVGKDVLGGDQEEGEEPMPPGLLFALLNFAVFLGLLIKFARPKLLAFLRTRHEEVKGQLEDAARLRAEARAKLEEYNRRIAGVDAEVNNLLAEIRGEAEAEREMILAQARSQANALKAEAERRIESEIARARLTLEREVAVAAVAAAEKILRERTTGDDQARMFGNFVDALLAGPPGAKPETTTNVDEDWS